MKHEIAIAPNSAIYIDDYRVIGRKPYGLFVPIKTIKVTEQELKDLVDYCTQILSKGETT